MLQLWSICSIFCSLIWKKNLSLNSFIFSLVRLSSALEVWTSSWLPSPQWAWQRVRLWPRQPTQPDSALRSWDRCHVITAWPHPFLSRILLFLRVPNLLRTQRLRLPQCQHWGAQTATQDSRRPHSPASSPSSFRPLPSWAERTLGFGVDSWDDSDDPTWSTKSIPLLCG